MSGRRQIQGTLPRTTGPATLTEEDEAANVAYFDPDPSVSEAVLAAFGRTDRDDDLRLPADAVATVTDEQVRLTGDI